VVYDRGYTDYGWYNQLTQKGILFVNRLKKNAQYRIIKRRQIPRHRGMSGDQIIEFTGTQMRKKCPIRLRRIGYHDSETGKLCVFLTNHFTLGARTITDVYKQTLLSPSKNAVMTQIWIALCVYLLLALIKFQLTLDKSMGQILQLLQINLFEKRDLYTLLRGDPPDKNLGNTNQLAFI
jgi:hypothetical protein